MEPTLRRRGASGAANWDKEHKTGPNGVWGRPSGVDALRNLKSSAAQHPLSPAARYQVQLADIRGYVPGALRACATEAFASQEVSSPKRRTRIAFVGEFGAGKSSLINTIWHVLTEKRGSGFQKVAHTAHGPQSATTQPRSVIYEPDFSGEMNTGTFTLWDTPGFMQFNEFELAVMNTYVETGIRERQDTLGLVTGTEAGFPGGQALPVDHFVWVFGMNRLGVVAGGDGTVESKHSDEEKQPPAVSVTKKQLELTKEGRELFWQFFSCARTRAGSTPSVVLTHVDQFTGEEIAQAKRLVQTLTHVDPHDIFTIACYRSEWCPPPIHKPTHFQATNILHTMLRRADSDRDAVHVHDHAVRAMARAFVNLTHRGKLVVWHIKRAKYVYMCIFAVLVLVFGLAVALEVIVWGGGVTAADSVVLHQAEDSNASL